MSPIGKIKKSFATFNKGLSLSEANDIDLKAQSWCFKQGYKIYPIPSERCRGKCINFRIVVAFNGKKNISKKIYSDKEWSVVIWSIYKWLYNKHLKRNGKKA
tara:strand:+ start:8679 stop:8984 length:306 start_codon:yes stop_codon:yes gene_type:complete